MKPYRVSVDLEGIEFLRRARRRDQELIFQKPAQLEQDPFRSGDYPSHDTIGRVVQTLIVGRCAVTFWTDHAVCEVRVVKIEPPD